MARRLPTGVVIPKSTFTPDLQGLGTVDVSDIAMLWKVFSSQSSTKNVHDLTVRRLENLFWRIWGNGSVRKNLSGATLAKLFIEVTENKSARVFSTKSASEVVQLPGWMATADANVGRQSSTSIKSNASGEISPAQNVTGGQSISRKPSDTESEEASATSSKKPKPVITAVPAQKTKTKSISPTKASSKAPKAFPDSDAQKPTRMRTAFIANTAATSRRRGVLPRRKSSQTCPTVSTTERSATDRDPTPTQETEKSGYGNPSPQKSSPRGSALPEPAQLSWQSLSYLERARQANKSEKELKSPPAGFFSVSSVHHHNRGSEPSPERSESGSLVDPDFRGRFVQRRQQGAAESVNASPVVSTNASYSNLRELLASSAPRKDYAKDEVSTTAERPSRSVSRTRSSSRTVTPVVVTRIPLPSAATAGMTQQTSTGVFTVSKIPSNAQLSTLIERSRGVQEKDRP